MTQITNYLIFDGNCREAMKFYAEALGGELNVFTFGESPEPCKDVDKDLVMHARLTKGALNLMASDSGSEAPEKVRFGNNFSLSLNC